MKSASALLAFLSVALVSARPLRVRQTVDVVEALPAVVSCGVQQTVAPTVAGAAYCKIVILNLTTSKAQILFSGITNEPTGNFVITSDLYSDGTMVMRFLF